MTRLMRRRRRRTDARGQGLVEFALVIPIIVMLIAVFIEIGRAVYAYNTIANAARQAARVAVVNQLPDVTDCDESRPIEDPYEPHWSVMGCALLAGKTIGLSPANVTVAYVTPPSTTLSCSPTLHIGCIASVTVTFNYDITTPFVSRFIGPIAMSQTSEMPVERVFP
jgi:Flp pilus assembly protein TadG